MDFDVTGSTCPLVYHNALHVSAPSTSLMHQFSRGRLYTFMLSADGKVYTDFPRLPRNRLASFLSTYYIQCASGSVGEGSVVCREWRSVEPLKDIMLYSVTHSFHMHAGYARSGD